MINGIWKPNGNNKQSDEFYKEIFHSNNLKSIWIYPPKWSQCESWETLNYLKSFSKYFKVIQTLFLSIHIFPWHLHPATCPRRGASSFEPCAPLVDARCNIHLCIALPWNNESLYCMHARGLKYMLWPGMLDRYWHGCRCLLLDKPISNFHVNVHNLSLSLNMHVCSTRCRNRRSMFHGCDPFMT